MYRAVIFDIDGVLDQTENIHVAAVSSLFREIYNYELTEQDSRLVIGRHYDDYGPEIISLHQLDPKKFSEFVRRWPLEYPKFWDAQVELMPDVRDVLDQLQQKRIQLSLASNGTAAMINRFIERFGFQNVFNPITTGSEVINKKPDPGIYIAAKSKLNIAVDNILVVEDSGVGTQAARAAGLKVAAIPNQYTSYQDFTGADYIFKSLSEILQLF